MLARRHTPYLVLLLLLLEASQSSAVVTVYTDEASFVAALSEAQSLLDFNSESLGPLTGGEFSASGFVFSSPLSGAPGQLEIAPPDFFAPSQYLNIGERPFIPGDGNNDTLNVLISGDWSAFGVRFIDGTLPFGNESITFFDDSNEVIYSRTPVDGETAYLGIVTAQPIRRVSIVEATNDGDDVGYDNFRLGNPVSGDFDLDGDVDGRDFLLWQRGGSPNPFSAADLADWQANYGVGPLVSALHIFPAAEATSPVPEPGSLFLSVIGLAVLFRRNFARKVPGDFYCV